MRCTIRNKGVIKLSFVTHLYNRKISPECWKENIQPVVPRNVNATLNTKTCSDLYVTTDHVWNTEGMETRCNKAQVVSRTSVCLGDLPIASEYGAYFRRRDLCHSQRSPKPVDERSFSAVHRQLVPLKRTLSVVLNVVESFVHTE
jgi:hypothetical protein